MSEERKKAVIECLGYEAVDGDEIEAMHTYIDALGERIKHLEHCLMTLTIWLAQSQVFGQQDVDAMSELLTEKNDSSDVEKGK